MVHRQRWHALFRCSRHGAQCGWLLHFETCPKTCLWRAAPGAGEGNTLLRCHWHDKLGPLLVDGMSATATDTLIVKCGCQHGTGLTTYPGTPEAAGVPVHLAWPVGVMAVSLTTMKAATKVQWRLRLSAASRRWQHPWPDHALWMEQPLWPEQSSKWTDALLELHATGHR